MKKDKIISLFVVFIMLLTAAVSVNKALFGHDISKESRNEEVLQENNPATEEKDGVTIIHTSGLPGTIDGYAGPVPLDIYIDKGKISRIKTLPNAETESFFERSKNVLEQWIGKTPEEALNIKVDAVSGATYSSSAIINNIRVGLSSYQGTKNKPGTATPWKIWVALGVTLCACIIPLLVNNRIYNTIQLIANIAVLGFWCGQFLDYSIILRVVSDGFIWPAGFVIIAMLTAAFIYPLFGRPQHYCNHVCPFGSAQLLMAKVCRYKIKINTNVLKGLDWFRKILWAVLLLFLWIDCLTDWMNLELFQAFNVESAELGIMIAAGIFVILSTVVSRPYCRFVCPTGSLFKRAENLG